MDRCPNFNDKKYQELEKVAGDLEAFKYWHQKGGDLSAINETKPASIIGLLQAQGRLGKRVGDSTYKLDGDEGNPIAQDFKAYQLAQELNAKLGKEVINHVTIPGIGFGIQLDQNIYDLVKGLNLDDRIVYNDFLNKNLYTEKQNPTTTELVNNAGLLAMDLGRQDLVNMARFINKYLDRNQSLSVEINSSMPSHLPSNTKAYYSFNGNVAVFARDKIGTSTLENETQAVLEELFHGLTVQPFYKQEAGKQLTENEKNFVDTVNRYFKAYRLAEGADRTSHRFENAREFLVGALMDAKFKDHLSTLQNPAEKDNFFTHMMKSLVNALMRIFGFTPKADEVNKIAHESLEESLFRATKDYLDNTDKVSLWNGLKEQGRNYGLSFTITSDGDVQNEYDKMKGKFTPKMREDVKKIITKSVDLIQNASSVLREGSEEFKQIFRQLHRLEDPASNLDQIDFFFDMTEGIGAVINTIADKIDRLINDDTLTDQDFKLGEYDKLVATKRNLEPVIDEIGRIRTSLKKIGALEPAKEIETMLTKMAVIEQQYSEGVLPLVTDKLTEIAGPGNKKAIDISNEHIAALRKSYDRAVANNATSRAKVIKKDIDKEVDKLNRIYNLSGDKIASWLRGEMGDVSVFMAWSMAGVSSKHPIVASVAKFIRDKMAEPAPRIVNDIQNPMQSAVEEYERNTGRSRNDIRKFNEPLIQTHQEISGVNEDGTYKKKKVFSLIHEFNGGHIEQLQKFRRDLGQLRELKSTLEDTPNTPIEDIRRIEQKMKDLKEDQRRFKRDYMEQPYKPEVHEAIDMIYKDLGGYTASDYLKTRYENIEAIEEKIEQENNPAKIDDLYDQLDDANTELKRLTSLYEKSPDDREYKVAQTLKERNKLMSQYSKFELTKKGEAKFNADMTRLKVQLDKGKISKDQYERELESNTTTQLTDEYWNTKKSIISEMTDILKELGVKGDKNEELAPLYTALEDIAKPHRDHNGIIDGQAMSDKELLDSKNIEEKLERAKDLIPNIMGLSKMERIELSNLYNQLSETEGRSQGYTDEEGGTSAARGEIINRINQIESRKRHLDKALLTRYFIAIKKLSDLDRTTDTAYYTDELAERTAQIQYSVDISKIPSRFFLEGKRYVKSGEQWAEVGPSGTTLIDKSSAENKWRAVQGEINLKDSDWWKNNHILRNKWVPNESYDPNSGGISGDWEQVEEPTYPWRQTRPADSKYIEENKPSIKYKKRIFKDEYKNPNYREDITGVPRPKLHGAKDNRFINQDYSNLRDSNSSVDQATFKYLQHLTNLHLKSQQGLPYNKRPGYKLPSIRQSWVERFLSTSLTDKTDDLFERIGQIKRLWSDDVARNPQDKDILFGYNDDINGIVPRKFLGDIEPEDQSIDLSRILLTSAIDWTVAEQLQSALPFLNAVRDIMNDKSNMPVKTKGGIPETFKRRFSKKGQESAVRQSYSNAAMQVNEIIKTMIYGEQMKDTPITKFVNSALGVTAKLLLGFNFASSIQNYANANTQAMLETESKRSGNFTLAEAYKGRRIYYSAMHELMSDLGKVGNKSYINQFFDYFGGINMKLLSHDKAFAHKAVREFISNIATPNQITEHMLNYELALSVAQGYRVKGIENGQEKMLPIFDAFTLKDNKIQVKDGFTVTEADRQEMISRLNSTARRINGEYGDMIVAQKHVLGKSALFMNRYVVPFTVKRYGARDFDIQDGIRDEGYWRLLGKVILKDIRSKSLPLTTGWKYYSPAEKVAIKRAATEFGFTVMFWGMMGLLGGNDDKHLKDNGWAANNLIYVLKGIQQQNEAFMPVPGVGFDDLLRKVQNPFPILGKVKNLVSLIQDSSHALYYEMGLPGVDENDVFYTKKQGWHKPGDLKIMSDIEKLLAIPYRVHQWFNADQAIKNQDLISRIK